MKYILIGLILFVGFLQPSYSNVQRFCTPHGCCVDKCPCVKKCLCDCACKRKKT